MARTPQTDAPEDAPLTHLAEAITTIGAISAMGLEPKPHPAGGQVMIVPDGYRAERLEPLQQPLPESIVQTVTMTDLASMNAYVNDFKTEITRVFACLPDGERAGQPTIMAVLDYHAAETLTVHRCSHRVVYAPTVDPLWAAWSAIDGRAQAQMTFAEFLEEHAIEVLDPPGADVLETVAGLKAKKKVDFESAVELQTGAVKLTYREEVEGRGKGEMEVPARLTLGMPIFFNGPPYEIECRLRYRIDDSGKLAFVVKIHRRELLLRDALDQIVETFTAGTELPVHFGRMG